MTRTGALLMAVSMAIIMLLAGITTLALYKMEQFEEGEVHGKYEGLEGLRDWTLEEYK